MERVRFGVALGTASALLLQTLLPPRVWAAPEPITETLLDQPSGAPTAGRLWPGLSAAEGLDTGAQADPNDTRNVQVDTGAQAEPTGAPPAPLQTDLSPGGIPSGGDLTAPTVPWMGTGAPAPQTPPTVPLTGGMPTSGGTSLGGGSPLGPGTSLPNMGNLAAGLLGQTMPGMPGMPGLAGLGALGQIPGLQGLGSVMSLVGMLSILNSLPQMISQLPQMISQLPQMLLQSIQSIGQMFLSIFQLPQAIWQALTGMGQGFMGLGGQLGQQWGSPAAGGMGVPQQAAAMGLGGGVSGAGGGVAGATPSTGAQGSGKNRQWKGYVPTDVEKLRAMLPEHAKYLAGTFVEMGQKYNIDPLFLVSISHFETGRWSSNAFLNKNNGMGISNAGGPTAQASTVTSIETIARSLSGAPGTAGLYNGANTVQAAGLIYCPPGAPNDFRGTNYLWGQHVGSIYDNYVNALR